MHATEPSRLFHDPVFDSWGRLTQIYGSLLQQLCPGSANYRYSQSVVPIEQHHLDILALLMKAVRTTGQHGTYIGTAMTPDRTRLAAEMSGDPLCDNSIARNMDALTQAFAALKLELHNTQLTPEKVDINFHKQPAFLEKNSVCICIASALSTADHERIIQVFEWGEGQEIKHVVTVLVTLRENRFSNDRTWIHVLMACWHIFAQVAKTWPDCSYERQTIIFDQLLDNKVMVTDVRGMGRNENGHCLVSTQAYEAGHRLVPFATGQGTILLPSSG